MGACPARAALCPRTASPTRTPSLVVNTTATAPASRLRLAGNVLSDLAQMHRLRKNQADNDPDPISDPSQVRLGMDGTQLRKHAGVQFLTDAHEIGLSV